MAVQELLAESSELAAAALVLPGSDREPADAVLAWRERFQAAVAPQQPHLFKAVRFAQLQPALDALFPLEAAPAPRLLEYRDAVWIRGSGALYDGRTGLALPGSYLSRFPRQRQAPNCSTFRVELTHPLSALPCLERAVLLPFAPCGNFGHFITETLGFLWPFLLDPGHDLTGWPVLLAGCQAVDPATTLVHALIRQRHGFPLLEEHLPASLRIRQVLVPEPSLRLHGACTPTAIHSAEALGDWLLAQQPFSLAPAEKLFISRTALPGEVRSVDQEPALEALLQARGWTVLHPEQHTLAEQAGFYRAARVVAGFEGSALHGLALVGQASPGPGLVMLGDQASPDYFLQFRAQGLPGFFIQCTRVDPDCSRPDWVRRRLLNGDPHQLAQLLEALVAAF